jgi:hypothetical protein
MNTKNVENALDKFDRIHPTIKFTMEKETQSRINYLDLTIAKEHNKLTFGIYRKPTTTDSIIHNDSCHRSEHKKSAINYLINRMNTYPLTQANKDQEQTIIKETLQKKGYQQSITNHKQINKPLINISQTTQATQKENGSPSHILAQRPELLLTYFRIQTSKLPTRLPIQLNTT